MNDAREKQISDCNRCLVRTNHTLPSLLHPCWSLPLFSLSFLLFSPSFLSPLLLPPSPLLPTHTHPLYPHIRNARESNDLNTSVKNLFTCMYMTREKVMTCIHPLTSADAAVDDALSLMLGRKRTDTMQLSWASVTFLRMEPFERRRRRKK